VAVNGGFGLPIVAGMLGHVFIEMMLRYAHLAEAPVIAAADWVSGRSAALLEPWSGDHA